MTQSPQHNEPDACLVGIDLGGTKCEVCISENGGELRILARFPSGSPDEVLGRVFQEITPLADGRRMAFGISCGGPLDAEQGLILSPPNLPGWDRIPICELFTQRFGNVARLMNDANACALAEWRHGAGKGCRDMVFLTMGTGMGSGMILNGRLYEGASGDAGEIGHMRMAAEGPVGYNKAGSFEGFCSGGGIAQLVRTRLATFPGNTKLKEVPIATISARDVGLAADSGDLFALEIWNEVGTKLGEGLSVITDVINPQRIVIGGIFPRCERLIAPAMNAAMAKESLMRSRAACTVVPAKLGEHIGSYAAIEVARYALNDLLKQS